MNVNTPVDRAVLGVSGMRPANEQANMLREKLPPAGQERRMVPVKSPVLNLREIDPHTVLGSIPKSNFAAAPGLLGTSDPAAIPLAEAPLTVDGLMAAWGKNDPTYDLDGDGIVGMGDLTELLSRIQSNMDPRPAGDVVSDAGPDPLADAQHPLPDVVAADNDAPEALGAPDSTGEPGLTVEGLMALWGKSDSTYDLDGDGIVGMGDLLELLARQQTESETPASVLVADDAEVGAPDAVGAQAPPTNAPELTVDGLMAAWGQRSEIYDLDGDGRVDMSDLLQLLSRLGEENGNGAPPPGEAPAQQNDLGALASHLVGAFRTHGFEDVPPGNLRAIIGGLGLPSEDAKGLLAHLAKHYPNGLGVNFKA